ncbi:hypothetical protein ABRT01_06095 [Lentibacillus sp. L22]|uniref:hypothetical protein n=1 Tax=Lentibacillus TaxID=175304 RepID=UPI0022B0F81E|nr:hypothetical protein [Lentibacillus daqui]
MKSELKILNVVKYVGCAVLTLGIAIFIYALMNQYGTMMGIGIGTVMGAIFIFLMGVFFVVTEEMERKTEKGIRLDP